MPLSYAGYLLEEVFLQTSGQINQYIFKTLMHFRYISDRPALSVVGEESWSLKDPKLEEMIHQSGYQSPQQMGINPMDCADYNSNIDPSRMNCINNMDNRTLNVQDGKIPIIETEGKIM